MKADSVALSIAVVLAAIMFIMYLWASQNERGVVPHYATEVFRAVVNVNDIDKVVKQYGAKIATQAQVATYTRLGGHAPGYALALANDSGKLVSVSTDPAPTDPAPTDPAPAGVWLYGPRPRRDSPNINPFNCSHWFQPELSSN